MTGILNASRKTVSYFYTFTSVSFYCIFYIYKFVFNSWSASADSPHDTFRKSHIVKAVQKKSDDHRSFSYPFLIILFRLQQLLLFVFFRPQKRVHGFGGFPIHAGHGRQCFDVGRAHRVQIRERLP